MKLIRTITVVSTMFLAFGGGDVWAAQTESNPFHWSNIGDSGMDAALTGSVGGRYESNAQSYSDDDIQNYDAGLQRTTKFVDVESIDDWVQDYTAGVYLEKEFAKGRPTRFEFRSNWNIYGENDNKDYQQYSFEFKQRVTRYDDIVKFRYTRLPSYFNRYLFDEDTASYSKSELGKDMFSVSYWKRLTRVIRFRVLYVLEDNDYASAFDERDNLTHNIDVKLIFDDVLPNLKVSPYYVYTTLDAEGSDNDPAVDDDISYDQHAVGVNVNYEFMPKWHITPFYEYDFRNYTTSNSVASDPLHAGREDDIFTVGVGLDYDLTENISVGAKYSYVESNVTTDIDPSLTTRDDVLGYSNHIVMLGADFNF